MITFGERLNFIRKHRDITQKELGLYLGFSEKTADIRIAQYETDQRTPRPELVEAIARILDVSTTCLTSPLPNTGMEIMQFLFWMEELPQIKQSDKLMQQWINKKKAYSDGLITHDQYLDWKLKFTES
ncbi:MAG: helix-turn-helix transcriptional regulator [Eubacteriales bacterium]|nr:helix-turn-helix transcriptional regulator [Eubacteriales bacterium]